MSSERWFACALASLSAGCTLVIVAALALARAQPSSAPMIFWSRAGETAALYLVDTHWLVKARLVSPPPVLVVDTPRPSNDGRRSAFEASSAGRLEVYVRDSRLRTLYATHPETEDRLPALSPDGRLMAYWSSVTLPNQARYHNWKLMLFDFEALQAHFLLDQLAVIPYDNPLWSPDGRRFAVRFWQAGGDAGTFVVDVASGEIRSMRAFVESGGDLAWSPDAESLAFRSTRDRNSEVYVLNLATGTVRNLTQHPANDFQPAWSSDARHIAFVSNRVDRGEVYVVPVSGGEARRLTEGGGWLPRWSPDNQEIAFVTQRDGQDALYVVKLDGQDLRRVAFLSDDHVFIGWHAP
jgi:Tol biopolymer transport system component